MSRIFKNNLKKYLKPREIKKKEYYSRNEKMEKKNVIIVEKSKNERADERLGVMLIEFTKLYQIFKKEQFTKSLIKQGQNTRKNESKGQFTKLYQI